MKEKAKWKQFLDKYVPRWAVLPLLTILAANCLIYWGSDLLTANRHHFDFTMGFDRAVPLVPFFVWFYILAFPFWAIGYLLSARRGKKTFYRFVATDLTIHLTCFILFLVIPTTNIRPELTDGTISERILGIVYAMDGGVHPSNLFPSIHCYVSWMCYRGLKGAREIPCVVSEIFLCICSTDHYFHPGIEAALYCGCCGRSGTCGNILEILQ